MENLNLEAYGLQEMSRTETSEIDGGGFWAIAGAGLVIAAGAEIIGDWDEFKAGFMSAF